MNMMSVAMRFEVKDVDLRNVDTRGAKLREMSRATRRAPNGEVTDLDEAIARFEAKHQITSAQMEAEITAGQRTESAEMLDWLMLLRQREIFSRRR